MELPKLSKQTKLIWNKILNYFVHCPDWNYRPENNKPLCYQLSHAEPPLPPPPLLAEFFNKTVLPQ
jgi:hypothetical protein